MALLSLLPRDFASAKVEAPKAQQACGPCKKQKRKCDKALPVCGLCARVNRQCDYTDSGLANPTSEDFAALQARLAQLESRLNTERQDPVEDYARSQSQALSASSHGLAMRSAALRSSTTTPTSLWAQRSSRFPNALILDFDVWSWAGLYPPKATVEIPPEVLAILGEGSTVEETSTAYFATVHPWFPFISKKRLLLGTSLWDTGPDSALLFLAMKLIITSPDPEAQPADTHLYYVTKRFLALLESGGCVSIAYLQSLILVALYEISQAIHPAGWMTVGACARYLEVLRLPAPKASARILGHFSTWTELEERRRAWWAVYILDRIICLGSKRRFAMPEPHETEIPALPADDDLWDTGDVSAAVANVEIYAPVTVQRGPFARLCQVAMLISRGLKHCRDTLAGSDVDGEGAKRIFAELEEMGEAIEQDMAAHTTPTNYRYRLIAARSMVWSTMVVVCDMYMCPEDIREWSDTGSVQVPQESELQPASSELMRIALDHVRNISLKVRDSFIKLLYSCNNERSDDFVPPLILESVYQSMASLQWLYKESGEEILGAALEDVKKILGRLGRRWRLGDEYLGLLQHHNVTSAQVQRHAMGWGGI